MTAVSVQEVYRTTTVYLGFCPKERRGGKLNWLLAADSLALPSLCSSILTALLGSTQVRGESRLSVFPLEPLSQDPWERRV